MRLPWTASALKTNESLEWVFALPAEDGADDIELKFPIEFLVEGIPLSLQASGQSKDAWKEEIRTAFGLVIPAHSWATESPVSVTIFYFPDGRMIGDIDNIIKPIIDAFKPRIYVDDQQVERVVAQKFESGGAARIDNPTPKLAEALDKEPPIVYIRIDNEISRNNNKSW